MKFRLARKTWLMFGGGIVVVVAGVAAYRFHQHEATCSAYEAEMKSNRIEFLLVDRQLSDLLGDGAYGFMVNRARIAELRANQERLADRAEVLVPSSVSVCGQKRYNKWFDANATELEFKKP